MSSAPGEETVTSSVAVPALTRQQALGPLLSRVVNDEDLAVLSVILEQIDDLDDVARLRQTCRVLRDGVDACMKVKRTVAGKEEKWFSTSNDIPWQLMAWEEKWIRNPWATWVARGDMRRERPDMTRALSRCGLVALRGGKELPRYSVARGIVLWARWDGDVVAGEGGGQGQGGR
jgi:hypothetical protein